MYKFKIALVNVIIAVSVAAVGSLSYLAYKHNSVEYAKSIETYNQNLRKVSSLVTSSTELNFITIDQTLQRATEQQSLRQLFGNVAVRSEVEASFSSWVNKTPHIDAMLYTDQNGLVQVLFRKGENNFDAKPGFMFAAKEHFSYHKNHPEQELLISTLKKDGKDTTGRIFISRRFERPNGDFGGLVVAVMDGTYLANLINSVDIGKETEKYLLLNDDDFLAGNVSDSDSKLALIKAMMSESDFKKANEGDIVISKRVINDSLNMFSFQKIPGLPITVSIIAKEKDIFANVREEQLHFFSFISLFIIFALVITGFSIVLARNMVRAEQAEQKARKASQAKSDFLAKMSHELRTPLNAIIGFSDMLSSGYFGKVSQVQIERLTDINLCGAHLLDLISDILEFSKGDANKLTLNEEDADIYNIARQAIRMVEQKAKSKGLDIINAISREAPILVADSRKLRQIILNLLSNAIKFTKPGGKVTLSAHFDQEANFVITVSDTGVGIAAEDIPKAMQVFEQINSDGSNEGTGLGLPLCKMLTELHGGVFAIESKVNVGTKAIVTLPASRVQEAGMSARSKAFKPIMAN